MQPTGQVIKKLRHLSASLILGVCIAGLGTPALAPIPSALSKPVQLQDIEPPRPVLASEQNKPAFMKTETAFQLVWQNQKASMTQYTLIAGIIGLFSGLGFIIARLWKRASSEWNKS
jgi:hypothetical protein